MGISPSKDDDANDAGSDRVATTERGGTTTGRTLPSISKSLSPPTIAKISHHEKWMNRLEELTTLETDVKDKLTKSMEEADLKPASDLPRKMQHYANVHSLRRTDEELDLQGEIDNLPRAGMAGAPDEANLLCLLLELMDAKTVVEVGVFRGITTLAFALCLRNMTEKSGKDVARKVIGLDVSEEFAEIGKKYWKKAGVDDIIDFRVGDAKETLSQLLQEKEYGEESVDLCFIDADKTSYDDYYEKCLKLTKKGGLIVVDNTLWGGRVLIPDDVLTTIGSMAKDEESPFVEDAKLSKDTKAIRLLTRKIYNDDRIERVSFLTIADGVTICRKK